MPKLVRQLNLLRDLLVLVTVGSVKADLPEFRYDGEEAGPEDVAAELRIPVIEAAVRMGGVSELKRFEVKYVHGGLAAHNVARGVGTTIQQRVHVYIRRKKKRKKKRRRNDDDSSGK